MPYDLLPMVISVNPIVPLVIIVPAPFTFDDTKAVPWIYDFIVYIHGQKVEDEPITSNEPTMNITRTSRVTRSGRIFAHGHPVIDYGGTSNQDKGKQVEASQQRQDSTPINNVKEFLCIIKRSEYNVVDQLNQALSKISILSWLMCSKAHRDALVKFLRAAHVPQEIPVCQNRRSSQQHSFQYKLGV